MQTSTIGKGPDRERIPVLNGESVDIAVGTPVCYAMDGTSDGVKVVLPSTGGATKATTLLAGVVVEKNLSTKLPKFGIAQMVGLCNTTKMMRMTRAASTDSWSSIVALAVGDILIIDTVNNCFQRTTAGAASAFYAGVIAAEALASVASAASATSDTRTAITTHIKTFLRLS